MQESVERHGQTQGMHDRFVMLDPGDMRWQKLVGSDPESNIFHHPAWAQVLSECYGYPSFVFAELDENAELTAGIPVMLVDSWLTGRRWVSLPFTDHCAALRQGAATERHLVRALLHLARERHIPKVELRWLYEHDPLLQHTSLNVLHKVALCPDSQEVARHFSPSHRRNIATAQRRGVCIRRGETVEDLARFYLLHAETRRSQGVPVQPWRFFRLIEKWILRRGLGFVLLAFHGDQCLAGAVFMHWQKTLTYKYGASHTAGLPFRPNNLIFWEAIRWGCENGYCIFDLGKTDVSNSGLRAFKTGWAAKEIPLTYSTFSQNHSKPEQANVTRVVLEKVIRNSPPWVCRIAGELLYGSFG